MVERLFFHHQNFFLRVAWIYLKMKTQAQTLNITFQLLSTSIVRDGTEEPTLTGLLEKRKEGRKTCL